MIKYSILDQSKIELSNNTTVRFDEGVMEGTVICFNPITLHEDETLSYGIDTLYFVYNKEDDNPPSDEQKQELLSIAHPIFLDLLLLFKGDIEYDRDA